MISKYKDLIIKIQRMWNVIAKVIPVIIGAIATISIKKKTLTTPEQHTRKVRN